MFGPVGLTLWPFHLRYLLRLYVGIRVGLDTGQSCADTHKFILFFTFLHQECLVWCKIYGCYLVGRYKRRVDVTLTSYRTGVILRRTLITFSHTYSASSVLHTYTFDLWPDMLALYVTCVIFIHPFIDQQLCAILFIPDFYFSCGAAAQRGPGPPH